jgi:hypothetical protein
MRRFWLPSRQITVANAFDHARHAHHRLNETTGQAQSQQAAEEHADKGDCEASQQGLGAPLSQLQIGKFQLNMPQ